MEMEVETEVEGETEVEDSASSPELAALAGCELGLRVGLRSRAANSDFSSLEKTREFALARL